MRQGLTAEGVSFQASGRTVLDDVSLSIAAGEVVSLLAPSGAGKSTMLRILVRLIEPDAGVVSLHGADVRTLDPCDLRRRVGLVAQTPVMLAGSVADNLRHGAEASDEEVSRALEVAGLARSFAQRTAQELSVGERARVTVARALTRNPEILLLDEPTAALDAVAAEQIGQSLRQLANMGLGLCVATHDVPFAERWTDRRIGLS
jgi:ABC-type multidrug transport system fused ATPase/permease subunit